MVRKRVGLISATASVAAERLTGFVMLIVLAMVALLPSAAATMLGHHRWWLLACLAAVLGASFLLVAVAPERLDKGPSARMQRRFLRFPRLGKLFNKGQGFARALLAYRRHPGSLMATLALSFLFYGMLAVFQWALLHAVGAKIGLMEAVIAAPLVILVHLLPISIPSYPDGVALRM